MTGQTSKTRPHARSGKNRPYRYTASLADRIERKWQAWWEEHGTFVQPNPGQPGFDASRPKFYCLDMFPYPSGAGLHVGHPEGYTATDIISRYKRMTGCNVLHPMGWDAFGLPAEQYAIETGIHPATTTRKSIDTFRRQLKRFGFSYDWSREFGTIDEDYYSWTQWIFLQIYGSWFDQHENKARPIADLIQMLEGRSERRSDLRADIRDALNTFIYDRRGGDADDSESAAWASLSNQEQRAFIDGQRLAYVGEQVVNWCPRLGTALANEEVIDGRSERGGFPVLRKPLMQWMFRITAYAERLLDGLEGLDWPESTRAMQTAWIGRSEGAEVDFPITSQVGRISEPTVGHPLNADRSLRVTATGFVGRDPYPPGEPSPTDLMGSIRNLPHLELPGATYFVTWKSKDGRILDDQERAETLRSLLHWDEQRCQVYAACIMPDHVHWIVRPFEGESITELTPSVKRFSAARINKRASSTGAVWQEDRFDHIIRDERWLAEFLRYVVRNPVEAGLCEVPTDYPFTFVSDAVREEDGVSIALNHNGRFGDSTYLRIYTTRPDTIFGATYMVVAPEHPLVDEVLENPADETDAHALRAYVEAARNRSDVERQESKEKTGVFTGRYCVNPATQKRIPIWVADYVLIGYGTGAIMAVPGQDERDWAFAETFDLPIIRTVQPPDGFDGTAYAGEGPAINSDFLNGLNIADAKAGIIHWLEEKGVGRGTVNYKLRDWLFSRQRYWGEPFPIVWDENGNHHAVGESALPVALPPLTDYAPEVSDEPRPLLAKAHAWVETTAGEAGVADGPWGLPASAKVTRETNTMPGWAGSCWYFLRYCDNRNSERFVDTDAERYWMGDTGVDLYIGGAEHAVLHLLYARFWHKVLFDLGFVSTDEPFTRLFHQGMITSFAYKREDGSLVPVDQVEEVGEDKYVETATGKAVTQTTAKMSKSLKNVANPDDVIAEYGADTFRLYEMYIGPLEATAPWNPRDIVGLFRFLQRAWRLIVDEDTGDLIAAETANKAVEKKLHRTIAKVAGDIERLSFNTAIAAMIEFVNTASSDGGLTRDQINRFARTLAPFAPHIAEEIWSRIDGDGCIADADWPAHDDAMLRDDEIEIPIQISGKVRARVRMQANLDVKQIERIALDDPKVAALIKGKTVRKVVVVPGRMVNIVAN